ncbi:MAG: response regulator transcription factor [Actinomycetes bacterium]
MSTVLICDDAPLAREAIRRVVADVPGVGSTTTASSGEELVSRYPVEHPDLTLLDVRMPGLGGVEAARRILVTDPRARVVMLTMGEDPDAVARAVAVGARGYLRKDASVEEIGVVLAQVLADPAPSGSTRRLRVAGEGAPALTEREYQVLAGMSRGRSNAEIGRELFLSEDTVKTHARRLFRKIGAGDRAHAVALGFRWGLVR